MGVEREGQVGMLLVVVVRLVQAAVEVALVVVPVWEVRVEVVAVVVVALLARWRCRIDSRHHRAPPIPPSGAPAASVAPLLLRVLRTLGALGTLGTLIDCGGISVVHVPLHSQLRGLYGLRLRNVSPSRLLHLQRCQSWD